MYTSGCISGIGKKMAVLSGGYPCRGVKIGEKDVQNLFYTSNRFYNLKKKQDIPMGIFFHADLIKG